MSEESLLSAAPEATETTEAAVENSGPAVERPEWLLDKYVTEDREMNDAIAEQAKAYAEAQKRLGGFTGAPEGDYEFSMPEGVDGELDPELETFKEFTEVARKYNMSNEAAQEFLNIYVKEQQSMMEQMSVDVNAQKELLGPQADERIGKVGQWANSNLSPEDVQVLESMTYRADQVELLEKLIGMTRQSKVPKTNEVSAPVGGFTERDFQAAVASEQYRDPKYRAEIRKKAEAAGLFS